MSRMFLRAGSSVSAGCGVRLQVIPIKLILPAETIRCSSSSHAPPVAWKHWRMGANETLLQ